MTDQGEHVPTPQEDRLYQALTAGDHDTIQELQDAALGIDPAAQDTPARAEPAPVEEPPDPAEEFERDKDRAWGRYQKDHEAPEKDRVKNTLERVREENHEAMEGL